MLQTSTASAGPAIAAATPTQRDRLTAADRALRLSWLISALVVLGSMAVASAAGEPLDRFLDEGTVLSAWSALQIFCVGIVSAMIYRWRASNREPHVDVGRTGRILWLLAAIGFFWLAIDEAFAVHEQIDVMIHATLGLSENPWTDRLDDLIVLGYGLIGVAALWRWRGELRVLRGVRPLLVRGFGLFFAMVAFDLATNGYSVNIEARDDKALLMLLGDLGTVAEESLKLLGEGVFLAVFVAIACTVRDRSARWSASTADVAV